MSQVVVLELVSAVALTLGVLVAVVQLRQHAKRRRQDAMLELMHSFQTPEMARALSLVLNQGEGLPPDQLRNLLGQKGQALAAHLFITFESIGFLVFRGELDFDLVRALFGGPVTRSWKVLQPYVEEERERRGWQRFSEWFQWLAEHIEKHEELMAQAPAYVAFREWCPPRTSWQQ